MAILRLRFVLPLVFMALVCRTAAAEPIPEGKLGSFAVPKTAKAPTIDGIIDANEWQCALAVGGLAQQNPGGNLLIFRPTTYFLMWDDKNIYLACRTWIMPGLKVGSAGRLPNSANAFDPGMEFNLRPMGQNAPKGAGEQSFKFFINSMCVTGDMARVAVGMLIRNWQPDFKRAWRQTAPGTAPLGGSWWEAEVVFSAEEFLLDGPNRVGDVWKMLLAYNHLPAFFQASVPINSSYFDTSGYPSFVLADEKTPAVQVSMDSIPGLKDGQAAVKFRVFNPTTAEISVDIMAELNELAKKPDPNDAKKQIVAPAELLKKTQTMKVAPGKVAEWAIDEPLPRDTGDATCTAFYQVKQGDKELYRYFVFFVRGFPGKDSAVERDRWVKAPVAKAAYPLVTQFNPVRNHLDIQADTFYLEDSNAAKSLAYTVMGEDDKVVVQGAIDQTKYYYFSRLIGIPAIAPGKYKVLTEMTLADGKKTGPVTSAFVKKDEAKEFAAWWGNKIGDVERVLPPFTKLTVKDNTVSLLERTYSVNSLGLPIAITSNGGKVLAAPVRIVAVIGGAAKTVAVPATVKITESKDWRCSFEGVADDAASGLKLAAKGWIEQDGLCYVELTYEPLGGKTLTIDSLRLEWPIAPENADNVVCIGSGGNFASHTARQLDLSKSGRLWSTLETGKGGSMMAVGSFYPQVWIGNEDRGLLWWSDSDRGWTPDDAVPAHEIVREGNELALWNNVIAKPLELTGPRTIAFSYNATPFKPLPKGWRMAIHSEDGTFGGNGKERKDPNTGRTVVAVQFICPPAVDPNDWSAVWAEFKAIGDQKIRNLQPFDPAAARNKDYVHTSIALMGNGPLTFDASVAGYFAPEWGATNSYGSVQRDYYLYLLDRSYRQGAIRTNYWDILYTQHFDTVQNAMAYELPDGRVQPCFNGWNLRRFLMRQYALQLDCGLAPGGIVGHATNAYPLVTFPWVDAVLNGEWGEITDATTRDWVDMYTPQYFRSLSTGQAFGTVISWMHLIHVRDSAKFCRNFRSMMDWIRLHDCAWYWQDGQRPPEAILDWGLNEPALKYVPYWRNDAITCDDKDVKIAYWQLPDRVMVMAFNSDSAAAKDVVLKVDAAKLGLAGKGTMTLRELRGIEGMDAQIKLKTPDPSPVLDGAKGTVAVTGLVPHTARYFGLRTNQAEEVKKLADAASPLAVKAGVDANAVPELQERLLDWGMAAADLKILPAGKAEQVTTDGNAEVAVLRLKDRVVLFVFNIGAGKAPTDLKVKIDLKALGLAPELPWQEFIQVRDFGPAEAGTKLDYYAGELTVPKVVPGKGQIIGIRRY